MDNNYLWIIDIDGTILNVHKNQVPAWTEAFQQAYNVTPDEKTLIKFFGKPFKSVLRNVALAYNVPEDKIEQEYEKALNVYTTSVCKYLDQMGGEILPGAVEFLEALGKLGMKRAIATGNPEKEGSYKLAHFDLLKYFDITVYCEDRKERIEMVQEAIRQGEQKYGLNLHDDTKRIVVVGDSHHDVESAQLTKGTMVAVTTGHWTAEQLKEAGATYVYSGVKDYKQIIKDVTGQTV